MGPWAPMGQIYQWAHGPRLPHENNNDDDNIDNDDDDDDDDDDFHEDH